MRKGRGHPSDLALASQSPVVVDFFETLVGLDHDVPRSWELLTALGYPSAPEVEAVWTPDSFDGCETPSGSDYADWHRWLLTEHARVCGVPTSQLSRVVSRLQENDRSWTVRANPEADRFLQTLTARNQSVVICTNWDYALGTYILQARLPASLPAVTSAEVGARKPNPKIFHRAFELLKTDAATLATVVGDNFNCDIVGALRVGCQPIWLTAEGDHPLVSLGHVTKVSTLGEALSAI
jgi:FMN phosphatase YigB (HAD superfamily)